MRRAAYSRPAAFTLIELLIVITIIGILVGLIVPAVMRARQSIIQRAMVMEVQTLANAVDQYKNKFGDYPPDGTDFNTFKNHVRRLFPNAAPTELAMVVAGSNCSVRASGGVMDPPEALVFFLGGFSKDPVHPFTGAGGPFAAAPSGGNSPYQYNVDRNEPFYEFIPSQLTIDLFNDKGNQITVSTDETAFGLPTPSGFPGDLIPVYHPKNKSAPFVYFDSRTYSLGGTFFDNYNLGASYGIARPYKASKGNTYDVNTKVIPKFPPTTPLEVARNDLYYRYVNERGYQIISAGLDDSYGGSLAATPVPLLFCYPSGRTLDITQDMSQMSGHRYMESIGTPSMQLDNATNFAEGILGDEVAD